MEVHPGIENGDLLRAEPLRRGDYLLGVFRIRHHAHGEGIQNVEEILHHRRVPVARIQPARDHGAAAQTQPGKDVEHIRPSHETVHQLDAVALDVLPKFPCQAEARRRVHPAQRKHGRWDMAAQVLQPLTVLETNDVRFEHRTVEPHRESGNQLLRSGIVFNRVEEQTDLQLSVIRHLVWHPTSRVNRPPG